MRRANQQMTYEDSIQLLKENDMMTVSMVDQNNLPYAVPVNYAINEAEKTIIFHGAVSGKKAEILKTGCPVHCSVVSEHEIVKEELSTKYHSVFVTGKMEIQLEGDGWEKNIKFMANRLAPDEPFDIKKATGRMAIFLVHIENVSGKTSKHYNGKK